MNKVFRALNDPTRREILERLKSSELTAGEIADAFNITRPSISHHLDILKQAGLVSSRREGQFIKYTIETTALEDALQWFIKLLNLE